MLVPLLDVGAAVATPSRQAQPCRNVHANAVVREIGGLPPDIRMNLAAIYPDMADPGSRLLDTDAPAEAERGLPVSRFLQALRVGDEWFVQIELAMTGGVTTFGYRRDHERRFRLSPSHYFRGPACASIEAALAGVLTPGGFDFQPPR